MIAAMIRPQKIIIQILRGNKENSVSSRWKPRFLTHAPPIAVLSSTTSCTMSWKEGGTVVLTVFEQLLDSPSFWHVPSYQLDEQDKLASMTMQLIRSID